MNRTSKFVVLALGLLGAGVLIWQRFRQDADSGHAGSRQLKTTAERQLPTESRAQSLLDRAPRKPPLFKSTRYPPETDAEKAMWEWWRAARRHNEAFEWQTPVEFFGVVVDQFGQPVAGAEAIIVRSVVGGTLENRVPTAVDGRFELSGVQGKGVTVEVHKTGFLSTRDSRKNFEYAAFFEELFHIPDKTKPVVFRLQKLMGAEPMLKHVVSSQQLKVGVAAMLDVEAGKLRPEGDLEFLITTGSARGENGPDYTVTVKANGGGLVASDEEFMFLAPEAGYEAARVFNRLVSEQDYRRTQPFQFYVRTKSGKYAAVVGEVRIYGGLNEGQAGISVVIYCNPSGSRNLEFDHRKWLNR